MFNLRLCNAATIRHSLLKLRHMHLCGKGFKYFSPHCCKCSSLGCFVAIRCGNACHGPHSDSVYSGSEHRQFNSPRLVKREAGFPNPRRALIGSSQLWRVIDILPRITISLKFVPKGPIDYKSALVQVMAWHRTGEKPLPESMLTKFTDACIYGTRGKWNNQVRKIFSLGFGTFCSVCFTLLEFT